MAFRPFFGGSAGFSSSNSYGAILATPDPIRCYNAPQVIGYKEYAKDNVESWLECARRNGHNIKLEDLILVTGVDLTTSWATAVFSDTQLEADFSLDVKFSSAGLGLGLACQLSWQNASSAFVNSGTTVTDTRGAHASADSSITHASADEPVTINEPEPKLIDVNPDQSLFIRHIRAKRRLPWGGLKLEARGESDDSDTSGGDDDTNGKDTTKGDLVIMSSSKHEQV